MCLHLPDGRWAANLGWPTGGTNFVFVVALSKCQCTELNHFLYATEMFNSALQRLQVRATSVSAYSYCGST